MLLERAHLVKSQHLSSHLTAIQQSDSHPVVDLNSAHQYQSLAGTETMERSSSCWEYVRSRPARRGRVSLLMSTLMILERGWDWRQQLTILPCLLLAMIATRGYKVASSECSKNCSKSVMTSCACGYGVAVSRASCKASKSSRRFTVCSREDAPKFDAALSQMPATAWTKSSDHPAKQPPVPIRLASAWRTIFEFQLLSTAFATFHLPSN